MKKTATVELMSKCLFNSSFMQLSIKIQSETKPVNLKLYLIVCFACLEIEKKMKTYHEVVIKGSLDYLEDATSKNLLFARG